MKTGYIKDSGYNIVGSALQSGQRLILVMGGMKSEKERGEEAKKLMEWGFRSFEQITLYKEGEKVGDASVYGGAEGTVPLTGERAIKVLVPRGNRDKLRARVVYMGPVKAPVEKGQKVGKLQVLRDEKVIQETALVTDADVAVGSLQGRAFDAATELVTGFIRDKVGFK